jgi:hypothetical protein
VARLAGVSTDYYVRLEQGRNIHPSRTVLDAVARALRLDSSEHAHMLDLLENCAGAPREPGANAAQGVRPALRQLLDAVGEVPALVLGRRNDVLAGNRMAFLLFADFPAGDPGGRPCGTYSCFIAVRGSGVDVPVSGFEGVLHGPLRVLRWDLENAEAKLRNGDAVVECQL